MINTRFSDSVLHNCRQHKVILNCFNGSTKRLLDGSTYHWWETARFAWQKYFWAGENATAYHPGPLLPCRWELHSLSSSDERLLCLQNGYRGCPIVLVMLWLSFCYSWIFDAHWKNIILNQYLGYTGCWNELNWNQNNWRKPALN